MHGRGLRVALFTRRCFGWGQASACFVRLHVPWCTRPPPCHAFLCGPQARRREDEERRRKAQAESLAAAAKARATGGEQGQRRGRLHWLLLQLLLPHPHPHPYPLGLAPSGALAPPPFARGCGRALWGHAQAPARRLQCVCVTWRPGASIWAAYRTHTHAHARTRSYGLPHHRLRCGPVPPPSPCRAGRPASWLPARLPVPRWRGAAAHQGGDGATLQGAAAGKGGEDRGGGWGGRMCRPR